MTPIYYEMPDMAVVNELKKRNAKTFGGNVRRKDRLDRFLKFEEKHRLSAQRAMWRRSRGLRHYQLWSSDHGQLLHEDPVEEYAPLAVDNGFTWSAVFFTIVGIVLIHLLTAMITIVVFVWRQNGFSFA